MTITTIIIIIVIAAIIGDTISIINTIIIRVIIDTNLAEEARQIGA